MGDTINTEIEVKLGDGSVVKGSNLEDAFKNLSEMKVHASNAIVEKTKLYETEKAERERIAAELEAIKKEKEALEQKVKPVVQPKPDDGKEFNKDTYFQLLGEDPRKAQNYVDAYRFGIDSPDKVPEAFTGMRSDLSRISQQVDVFTQQSVTAAFLAQHPEYPQGDADAAKLLTQRVNELTSKDGFPFNPSTIEFAYFQLVNDDKIKPVEEDKQDQQVQQQQSPNPQLSGAGAVAVDMGEVTKAEQMSDADLLKLLQAKGMFK